MKKQRLLKNQEIHMRDPYILVYEGRYYMYGTRGENCFTGPMDGFDCYVGTDLESWEGPYEIYHNNGSNKATWSYYAPECYEIDGKFYLLCSWKEAGSQYEYENILVADNPLGPFEIYAEDLLEGIDATLYQEDGCYYLINRHNLTKENSGIYATRLSSDLKSVVGEPRQLFTTADCPWTNEFHYNGKPNHLADGPCPYVTSTGKLLMFWSSIDKNDLYNLGICASDNGRLDGNWKHEAEPFFDGDKGHNMLFTSLEGQRMTAMHCPNRFGEEHPFFMPVREDKEQDTLRPGKGGNRA